MLLVGLSLVSAVGCVAGDPDVDESTESAVEGLIADEFPGVELGKRGVVEGLDGSPGDIEESAPASAPGGTKMEPEPIPWQPPKPPEKSPSGGQPPIPT